MTDIKSYFHEWCAKTKVDPKYEVRPTGEYFISIFIAFYFPNKNFASVHTNIFQGRNTGNVFYAKYAFHNMLMLLLEILRIKKMLNEMQHVILLTF